MSILDASQWTGVGIYTIPEAARLIETNTIRVRRWLEGYRFPLKSGIGESAPIFKPHLPQIAGHRAICFLDLVELLFIKAFREHGVTLPTIRLAAREAARRWNTDHPFCLERFATDGRTIFSTIEDDSGDKLLLDLIRSQLAFERILRPFLTQLDYSRVGASIERWWPLGKKKRVFLDPKIAFGRPVVVDSAIPTEVLYEAVRVNESEADVAHWYGVSTSAVRVAVEFENGLSGKRAA
jgi:uncharacterized protein (DUF433 family)